MLGINKKYLRNEKSKMDFLYAVKNYIVQFLDYERMTVIHGRKSHNRLMEEAGIERTEDGKSEKELTFEIGSNSDLILENTITGNLDWTIKEFSKTNRGY